MQSAFENCFSKALYFIKKFLLIPAFLQVLSFYGNTRCAVFMIDQAAMKAAFPTNHFTETRFAFTAVRIIDKIIIYNKRILFTNNHRPAA
jgi:hypothetical protein